MLLGRKKQLFGFSLLVTIIIVTLHPHTIPFTSVRQGMKGMVYDKEEP